MSLVASCRVLSISLESKMAAADMRSDRLFLTSKLNDAHSNIIPLMRGFQDKKYISGFLK